MRFYTSTIINEPAKGIYKNDKASRMSTNSVGKLYVAYEYIKNTIDKDRLWI